MIKTERPKPKKAGIGSLTDPASKSGHSLGPWAFTNLSEPQCPHF